MKKFILLKQNEKRALKVLKEELCKRFKIIDFRIFGSRARGDNTPESDIDVMIEIGESNSQIESKIDDIVFEINLKYDTFFSLVIFSEKEIVEGPLSESPLFKIIQKEGVTV